jgi:hypothetical protein
VTPPPAAAAASPPAEPIVLVLPALDYATVRRAGWLAMRPTRLQRVFLLVLSAALLALCGHLALVGEATAVARGVGRVVAVALFYAVALELVAFVAWRMNADDRMPSLIMAGPDGILCRRYDPELIPWRDVTWWDASAAILLLRVRKGPIVVVPRPPGEDSGWQSLRELVAARVRHADRAESRGWILILALLALLILAVIVTLARRDDWGASGEGDGSARSVSPHPSSRRASSIQNSVGRTIGMSS